MCIRPVHVLRRILIERRGELVERWRASVRGYATPQGMDEAQVLDTLPLFLEELAETLQRAADTGASTEQLTVLAREHGAQRFSVGLNLASVVREYGVLRDQILDMVHEEGAVLSTAAFRALSQHFENAISIAITEYTRRRDQQIEEQDAAHFGFLAHELRTPLSTALLAVDRIRRLHPEVGSSLVDRLERSLHALSSHLDHTLVEMKLRGAQHLDRSHFDLRELIAECTDLVQIQRTAREIDVAIEAPVAVSVHADRRAIAAVLTNLVVNAVKFTKPGGQVVVRCSVRDSLAAVEVQDECGGLPEGATQRLFVPFVQQGRDRTGFGLGLAICKQAIEAHGGVIEAVDLPGRGCIFAFSLPIGLETAG